LKTFYYKNHANGGGYQAFYSSPVYLAQCKTRNCWGYYCLDRYGCGFILCRQNVPGINLIKQPCVACWAFRICICIRYFNHMDFNIFRNATFLKPQYRPIVLKGKALKK